jgi:hypothetical protein
MSQQFFYGAPRPEEITKTSDYSEVKSKYRNNSSCPNNLVAFWKNNKHKLKEKYNILNNWSTEFCYEGKWNDRQWRRSPNSNWLSLVCEGLWLHLAVRSYGVLLVRRDWGRLIFSCTCIVSKAAPNSQNCGHVYWFIIRAMSCVLLQLWEQYIHPTVCLTRFYSYFLRILENTVYCIESTCSKMLYSPFTS